MVERSVPGAISVTARSLAPDLARGAVLLFIALANVHTYLYGHPVGVRGYPIPESILDKVVVLLQVAVVDGRAYPMFALLFGYGMVQLLRRHTAGGVDVVTVRKLVRRRGWWMILFGFLHALLLFSGDIIGAYGLLAVLLAGLLTRVGDRTLMIMVVVWMVPVVALSVLASLSVPEAATLPTIADPMVASLWRIAEWIDSTVVTSLFILVPAVLLGAWAARRRLLDAPEHRRRLLAWAAALGVGLAAVGGMPLALMAGHWWPAPPAETLALATVVHTVTGYAGGVGYAAIAGLVAIRVGQRRGLVVTALAACGQRSMTCYLLQSVVFVAVLAAYGGGLGDRLALAPVTVLATGTWAMTVVLAEFMRRRGYRGPAEALLRRLTYRGRDAEPTIPGAGS
jgi:uncharacterized protein